MAPMQQPDPQHNTLRLLDGPGYLDYSPSYPSTPQHPASATPAVDPFSTALLPPGDILGLSSSYSARPWTELQAGSTGPQAQPSSAQAPISQAMQQTLQQQQQQQQQHVPSVDDLLAGMPSRGEDAARHVMFSELIRLKTRSLELEIAQARTKEKEAELELAKWRAKAERPLSSASATAGASAHLSPVNPQPQVATMPSVATQNQPRQLSQPRAAAPTPMVNFDIEAMMHQANLDSLFSWMPEYGDAASQAQAHMAHSGSIDSDIFLSALPTIPEGVQPTPAPNANISPTSPTKRRSISPGSDMDASSPPPTKRSRRTTEKKTVVERSTPCRQCQKPLVRIMFRAPRAQIPDDISIDLACLDCAHVEALAPLPDSATMGTSIGTVDVRKRLRTSMEVEDEEKKALVRRTFCDVCQRVVASGRLVGSGGKENLALIAEIVCSSCDAKYQRCTDCGGGGGPRVGIGKWRMKQVFHPGRKTCSLSHSRLGDRPREIGVHVTPTDFTAQQLKEVLTRTKGLWNEKTLARLAVPEMLEIDLPPDHVNPLKNYADVEGVMTRNWPTREAMIRADGVDPARFKRLLSLTWAHAKSRRAVRTVDLEEEYAKAAGEDDETDMSTVLANVKRTNIVIPPGSELVGMWGGEWDMEHGALLISTLIPFEGTDGEDSTALPVGELITKVQSLRTAINEARKSKAKAQGTELPLLLPPCEHLWVVSGGTMPLVRERIADLLIRKRSFVHVEEYLTRHPDFIHALNARPVGLHPDLHRPLGDNGGSGQGRGGGGEGDEADSKPLILVRWLGKDFDAQKINEIKQQEFGGKAKAKKKAGKK